MGVAAWRWAEPWAGLESVGRVATHWVELGAGREVESRGGGRGAPPTPTLSSRGSALGPALPVGALWLGAAWLLHRPQARLPQ